MTAVLLELEIQEGVERPNPGSEFARICYVIRTRPEFGLKEWIRVWITLYLWQPQDFNLRKQRNTWNAEFGRKAKMRIYERCPW